MNTLAVAFVWHRRRTSFLRYLKQQWGYGRAEALLFPIDWPEPFGLGMVEAMACGTPVVAFRRGAAPEVVEEGVTGFVVDTEAEATDALRAAASLDRAAVRARFEARFTADRMAAGYEAVYRVLRS